MTTPNEYTQVLAPEESLELLATSSFGRLVVRRKDDMDLFPLNYAVHDGKVYFRTAEGTKLFSVNLDHEVLFEADHVDREASQAWSVIIKGSARPLVSNAEILAAEDYGLEPWLPSFKYNFVEITPREISGRKFRLGEEPQRY